MVSGIRLLRSIFYDFLDTMLNLGVKGECSPLLTHFMFYSYDEKTEIETLGNIEVNVEFQNQSVHAPLNIVKGNSAPLFGRDRHLLFNIGLNIIF